MQQKRMKSVAFAATQGIAETFKLLWQFKYGVVIYLFCYCLFVIEYANPTADTSLYILAKKFSDSRDFISYDAYINIVKNILSISLCVFFIGTSNMRNHPRLAKIIFFSPIMLVTIWLFVNNIVFQIALIYLLTILGIIGFMFFNLSIIKLYRLNAVDKKLNQSNVKLIDILLKTLNMISVFLLFGYLVFIKQSLLIGFASCIIASVIVISRYDHVLNQKEKEYIVWWKKWSNFDTIYATFVVSTFILKCFSANLNLGEFTSFNIFWMYLLFLRNIKKQNKIIGIFNLRCPNLIAQTLSQYFYYGSWIVSGCYVILRIAECLFYGYEYLKDIYFSVASGFGA